jgi:lipoprotein-releasing system permease protein
MMLFFRTCQISHESTILFKILQLCNHLLGRHVDLKLTLFIAFRYLFSKKSRNVINLISGISGITVMVITAALIILLSAFNGLEAWVISLFNQADPELKIELREGKTFENDTALLSQIRAVDGVKTASPVLQDNALFLYGDKQYIGILKGIEAENPSYQGIAPLMLDGSPEIFHDSIPFCLPAAGVANILGINLDNASRRVVMYFPKRGKKMDLFAPFRSVAAFPSGVFSIQQDYDSRYVWVPLPLAEEVLDAENKITALEIAVESGWNTETVKIRIAGLLPPELTVKNRLEQQAVFYKVFKSEKLMLTLILSFILLLASFNIFGALTMLLVEKRKDTAVLRSIGFSAAKIRTMFWSQGFLITLVGCLAGVILGLAVCLLQISTGMIKSGPQEGAPPYPIIVHGGDVIFSVALVIITGALVSALRMVLVKKTYFSASLRSGR